jgi:hypothetical protein
MTGRPPAHDGVQRPRVTEVDPHRLDRLERALQSKQEIIASLLDQIAELERALRSR